MGRYAGPLWGISMKHQIVMVFIWAGIAAACGRMPANYNQILVTCGDMGPADYTSAGNLFQVHDDQGELIPSDRLKAQWVKGQRSEELPISIRGCVVTPKAEGLLKIISIDGKLGAILRPLEELTVAPNALRLKPLQDFSYQLSCPKREVNGLANLDLSLLWNRGQAQDFWQIEKLALISQRLGESSARRVSLPVQSFLAEPNLMLAPLTLPDGQYTLKLELTTIAGLVINSETACQIVFDQKVPDSQKLLTQSVADGNASLVIPPIQSGEQLYICISAPDRKNCEDLNLYEKAYDLIKTPVSGSLVVNSFVEDSAGNRSIRLQEPLYRDLEAPTLTATWNNENLRQGSNWSTEPEASYGITMDVQDDSVTAGFMTNLELINNLECSVAIVDQTGASRGSGEAICQSGPCQGQSLESWVSCGLNTKFSFKKNTESALFYSQVIFRARSRDLANHVTVAEQRFWMHPEAWGMWAQNSSTIIPSNSGRHDFLSDGNGNFFRFTGALDTSPSENFPAISYKYRDKSGWTKPIYIIDSGTAGSYAASNERFPIVGFSTQAADRSLWYVSVNAQGYALAEVPLPDWSKGHPPDALPAVVRNIPDQIVRAFDSTDIWIAGMTNVTDPDGQQRIVFLVRSFFDLYAFVAFNGREFDLLHVQRRVDNMVSMKNDLVFTPDHKGLIFVLGNKLAVFDLESNTIKLPTELSATATGFRGLKLDSKGYFGYTDQFRLFTAQFNPDASAYTLSMLAEPPPIVLPGIDVDPFSHLVRTGQGDFWLSALKKGKIAQLYRLRPNVDKQWRSQDALWGWPNQLIAFGTFALGWDQHTDRLYYATSTSQSELGGNSPLFVHGLQSCEFLNVTEQATFRPDQKSNPAARVFLNQDTEGNLWRAQVLVNLEVTVSKMDDSSQLGIFDIDSTLFDLVLNDPLSQRQGLLVEDGGNFLLPGAEISDGQQTILRLDRASSQITEAFALPESRRTSLGDTAGSIWTLDTHEIQVRTKEGRLRSIPIPEPWVAWNMARVDDDYAWVTAFDTGSDVSASKQWKLFSLDLKQGVLNDDSGFANKLAEVSSVIQDKGRRLALVKVPIESNSSSVGPFQLQIFEDVGHGWHAWSLDRQPRLPAWHVQAGAPISSSFRSNVSFYRNPANKEIWLSTADSYDRPLLARLNKAGWQFFDPEKQTISSPVIDFQSDKAGHLYLVTKDQIFIANDACSSQQP